MDTKIISGLVLAFVATLLGGWKSQPPSDLKASIARGKQIYGTQCVTCHRENGRGVKEVYPPLAESNYLLASKAAPVSVVLNGAKGEITVNGVKYDNEMLSLDITDQQVCDVLNYVRNSWGNRGEAITPDDVATLRKKTEKRLKPESSV
jgi:mono/diheme cytochrome c family protein